MGDGSSYQKNQTTALGTSVQYEPYYLTTDYDITRNEATTKRLDDVTTRQDSDLTRTRAAGGFQNTAYDNAIFGEQF